MNAQDTEDGANERDGHGDIEPCCEQTAYLSRSQFDDRHRSGDRKGSNTQAAYDPSRIQSRKPWRKRGHKLPNNPDHAIHTKGPKSPDAVIEKERESSTDCQSDVYNGNKIADLLCIGPGADPEVLLESWKRWDDR